MKARIDRIIKSLPWPDRTSNIFTDQGRVKETEFIIGPYLGQMGFEISFILAAIWPWLNNGWKIIARRPELYPQGTTIHDDDLLRKIDEIAEGVRLYPHQGQLKSDQKFNVNAELITKNEADAIVYELNIDGLEPSLVIPIVMAEKHIRRLVGERVLQAKRPQIFWDDYFYRVIGTHPDEDYFYYDHQSMLAPLHKPPLFTNGVQACGPHIGLWMNEYDREGESLAQQAATFFDLPIIHYQGRQIQDEAMRQSQSLLARQLCSLPSCALMIFPAGDGLELMAWLQIPTIVTKQQGFPNLNRLAIFKPNLACFEPSQAMEDQIKRLMARRSEVIMGEHNRQTSRQTQPFGRDNLAYW